MIIRRFAVLFAAAASLVACDGLREALTAHVDVVARVEDDELSVTRLSDLLGNTVLQIPMDRETADILTGLWVDYHLLALAAAHRDVADSALIDRATRGLKANIILRRYMDSVMTTLVVDSASEATYTQADGGIFVARHILFQVPGNATPQQRDSVRRRAESVRGQVTSENFAAMARRYSSDPGSAQRGGDLGAFHREEMVKPFGDAVAALRPGAISPLVETSFGYHIIQRPTYASAREEYAAAYIEASRQRAESVFLARLDSGAHIQLKSGAATDAKNAARELPVHRDDDDVLATYQGGSLTVGEFVTWVESYSPQMRLPQQMAGAPDSLVRRFVQNMARNEVMLQKADSAGITLTADERTRVYSDFRALIAQIWQRLGISPSQLGDSAQSTPERERLAASRAEAYLDRIMSGQAQPLPVPTPVQNVFMTKYETHTYPAGLDRAVERAKALRAAKDSTRIANQPPTQVPLPGAPADSTRPDSGGRR